ncbi:MAG: hypothetical protein DRI57_16350 [Deltaproteobacteria bacterium]|nr:MAG: hypothetical protein DRI57_16350 [Deltaproteobacteria bacterium]
MKTDTKERAARLFLSSLLSSDLSRHDIREISEALLADNEFSRHLGMLIEGIVRNMAPPEMKIRPLPTFQDDNGVVNQTVSLIRKKRLSKKMITSVMASVSPGYAQYYGTMPEKFTLKEMLEKFLDYSGPGAFSDFMDMLQHRNLSDGSQIRDGSQVRDGYLEGIMNR